MADNTNRLAGIAYVSVDGKNYMLTGQLTYSPSTRTRATLVGQDRVHGYSEAPHQGSISGTFRDAKSLSVADFNAMTNVTVVAELANGKTVIGRNMWTADAQEVDTEQGTFSVKWEGPLVEEA